MNLSDWLKIRSGHGILIYLQSQGLSIRVISLTLDEKTIQTVFLFLHESLWPLWLETDFMTYETSIDPE